jgi:hypothetical protein
MNFSHLHPFDIAEVEGIKVWSKLYRRETLTLLRKARPGTRRDSIKVQILTHFTTTHIIKYSRKMSLDDWIDGERNTVDPEVRAYVGSLVNAVRNIFVCHVRA